MNLPERTALLVTAGLAFNAMPAPAAAETAAATPPALRLRPYNEQANNVMNQLGGKILALRQSAHHNKHLQDLTTNQIAPGKWEIEIDYTADRPHKHAPLGTYALTAAFAASSRKGLKPQNLVDVSLSENAGGRGPFASWDLRKDKDGSFDFTGVYKYPKQHYYERVVASTEPQADKEAFNSADIEKTDEQARKIELAAPTGKAINKALHRPFAKAVQPQPGPEQTPAQTPTTTTPTETPPPTDTTPTPPPSDTPPPQPNPTGSPFTAGAKGIDVSWANCNQTLPTNVDFAIIDINDGLGYTKNRCFDMEVSTYTGKIAAYYSNTGLYTGSPHYGNPNSPKVCATGDSLCMAYDYGYNSGLFDVGVLKGANINLTGLTVAEDVESDNSWTDDPAQNENSLLGKHDAFMDNGVPHIILYSNEDDYKKLLNNWQNGWAFWHPLGFSTVEAAQQDCNNPAPNGGTEWLEQYDHPNNVDQDFVC